MKLIVKNHTIQKKFPNKFKKHYADPYVKNRKGVFEYILGGWTRTQNF